MRTVVKATALAVFLCSAALAASAADTAPAGDPGEEIKDGIVKFGHGIRDGAVKAWGAVKSTVHDATADKPKVQRPAKDASAKDASKETK